MKTKLILFEGIPGSGKSTLAHKASLMLKKHNIANCLYREGDLHPANLDGYSIIRAEQLEDLFKRFPKNEAKIRSHMIQTDGHILIRLQKDFRVDSSIFRHLQQYAVWDNGLDFKLFERLHQNSWSLFSKGLADGNETAVFECAFLQDHITELMLFYEKSAFDIVEYFKELEKSILKLNPFLIYLQQNNVDETIGRISKQRIGEPDGRSWADRVAALISTSSYGKTNNLIGYDGMVEFFKRRKEIDLLVLKSLQIKHICIDNDHYDWKVIQRQVFQIIEGLTNE